MSPRIESILPGIEAELHTYDPARLRRVARIAAERAARRRGLSEPRAADALESLAAGRFGSTAERAAVSELADELDDEYWALEPSDDAAAHEPIASARLDAFQRARAASAIHAALDADPLSAALEALYEAWAALGSDDEAVRELLDAAGS